MREYWENWRRDAASKRHLVVGRGLLGTEVLAALRDIGISPYAAQSIPWDSQQLARVRIIDVVSSFVNQGGSKSWVIYWCAGAATMRSTQESVETELGHIYSLIQAIETSRHSDFESCQLVLASSIGGVLSGSLDNPLTELSRPAPLTPYGQLKLQQEDALSSLSHQTGIKLLIARISSLYGVKQKISKKQGLLSHVAKAAATHEFLEIFVSLTTVRNFIKASDAARLILDHVFSQHEQVRVANICSTENVSIATVIHSAEVILQRRIPVRFTEVAGFQAISEDLSVITRYNDMASRNVRTPLHVGLRELIDSAVYSAVAAVDL